jgi:hypothetical protein
VWGVIWLGLVCFLRKPPVMGKLRWWRWVFRKQR